MSGRILEGALYIFRFVLDVNGKLSSCDDVAAFWGNRSAQLCTIKSVLCSIIVVVGTVNRREVIAFHDVIAM